jgi:hypothetical protein
VRKGRAYQGTYEEVGISELRSAADALAARSSVSERLQASEPSAVAALAWEPDSSLPSRVSAPAKGGAWEDVSIRRPQHQTASRVGCQPLPSAIALPLLQKHKGKAQDEKEHKIITTVAKTSVSRRIPSCRPPTYVGSRKVAKERG